MAPKRKLKQTSNLKKSDDYSLSNSNKRNKIYISMKETEDALISIIMVLIYLFDFI